MAFKPGKLQVFKLDDETGSLKALTANIMEIQLSPSLASEESQTLGDNSVERTVTLADAQITITGLYDKTADNLYDVIKGLYTALRAGTVLSGSWEYYPEGETGGDPKITGECVIASFQLGGGVGGLVGLQATLDCSGDVTFGTA